MSIDFTYWYLLFLAIPLIGLSLIPYFKIGKKYRRTRNRIISLVLHCLTILLVTFALSGMTFVHSVANTANELILLVDVSNTQKEAADRRDGFINDVLRENVYRDFTVGVVTFGLNQVYAVPLTTNSNSVFNAYLEAELPDTSATDIEAALEYARTLFNHPESGKIVLVTDGKETDGNVVSSSAVSAITAQGTILDTVLVSSAYEENEYQIVNVRAPDYQVKKGAECTIEADIYSNNSGYVRVDLYDNGNHVEVGRDEDKTDNFTVLLAGGTQTVSLPYSFKESGMHELKLSIEPVEENGASDGMQINNAYFTYYNVEAHKNVLIIEAFENESAELTKVLRDTTVLGEGEEYEVSVYNLKTETVIRYVQDVTEEGTVPQSVNDFRYYDQVILNNIANNDLIKNADGTLRAIPLDKLLYSYVYEHGGGMITVGGSEPGSDPEDKKQIAHAYNRKDMYGKDFQKMLPVEAIDYTPPVGVFIIVDVSGSMSADFQGKQAIDWARDGAEAVCTLWPNGQGALSERDKIGILTLGNNYDEILPLTPVTQQDKVIPAVRGIKLANSGTEFFPSVEYAVERLRTAQMEKNHIVIVSDCEVSQDDMSATEKLIRECYLDPKLNLTVSIVNIGGAGDLERTQNLVTATRADGWEINGNAGCGYYSLTQGNVDWISYYMTSDVEAPTVSEIQHKSFQPIVLNELSPVVQGIDRVQEEDKDGNKRDTAFINATLNGYYGVKKKDAEGVDLVLTGNFQVPIYARWSFGKGSVGSFMCDLKGSEWSADFMRSEVGKRLIYNIIDDLMPAQNIRPQEIDLTLTSKNYGNYLTCPTQLEEGETIRGTIIAPDQREISLNQTGGDGGCVVKRALSESNRYSVCEFLIKEGGIYTIKIEKIDAEGNVLASASVVKEFSYSKEYDVEYDKTVEELTVIFGNISQGANGDVFDDMVRPEEIYREFETRLSKVFDPRLLFMILAVVLFLLDVAVRKFKFKWPHEIIRERKEQKQNGQIRKEERNEKDS